MPEAPSKKMQADQIMPSKNLINDLAFCEPNSRDLESNSIPADLVDPNQVDSFPFQFVGNTEEMILKHYDTNLKLRIFLILQLINQNQKVDFCKMFGIPQCGPSKKI
ncbi:hypothetical protein PtB15_16B355 [Puccinia triticina]|nr:hypothetical protein PtB15_16B355 [Puccinia triticina]